MWYYEHGANRCHVDIALCKWLEVKLNITAPQKNKTPTQQISNWNKISWMYPQQTNYKAIDHIKPIVQSMIMHHKHSSTSAKKMMNCNQNAQTPTAID